MIIKVMRMNSDAIVPSKKSKDDAAWDIYASKDTVIINGKSGIVETGIAIEYPEGFWGQIEGRSGLASRGIFPVGGIIDNGYRGEHKIIMINLSGEDYVVSKGDRIAQLVLRKHFHGDMVEVSELSETTRGTNGFGSSGK
ncbi:MAG: dUTP diphosphatase [Candidatus Delongbacteria bacterium]|nr:dUTP diphosphatase [Candidatus Delongbacteria bacterium]MBN2834747.1 dUTP diphosphatase [Candidatus Delongbacteria bacterium]